MSTEPVCCDECDCLLEEDGQRLTRYVLLVWWNGLGYVERRFCAGCAARLPCFTQSIRRIGGRVEWREVETDGATT